MATRLIFSLVSLTIFLHLFWAEPVNASLDQAPEPVSDFLKINPDSFIPSGAAIYNLPISVPPGRNDLTPKLTLLYNSNNKNGWLGVGWQLGVGSIQRSTKRGVDYDANDFIALKNGAKVELVARSDWGDQFYGAKIESAFSKYEFKGTQGWLCTSKDGMKYYYGQTSDSRQENAKGVFKWCLDYIVDTNGNFINISYWKDQGEIYLDCINYTGHIDGLDPTNSIKFTLEQQARHDELVEYGTGAAVTTAYRLNTITVSAKGDLAREYRLEYEKSEITNRSRLKYVTMCGTEEGCLPSTQFDYSDWSTDDKAFDQIDQQFEGGHLGIDWHKGHHRIIPGDFNGDGRTDFFLQGKKRSGNWCKDDNSSFIILADSNGYFEEINQTLTDDLWDTEHHLVKPGDFNGDGQADLFLQAMELDNANLAYLSNSKGRFNSYYQAWDNSSIDWTPDSHKIYPGDFNGDGRTDLFLQSVEEDEDWNYVFIAEGDGSFPTDPSQGWDNSNIPWDKSKRHIILGDFNGDGRTDILAQAQSAEYGNYLYLADESGHFGDSHQSWSSSEYNWDREQRYIITGDYNGDGKTDILLQGRSDDLATILFLSDEDSKFRNYHQAWHFSDFNWHSEAHQIVAGDFNGDGKTDLHLQAFKDENSNAVFLANTSGGFDPHPDDAYQVWQDGDLGVSWDANIRNVINGDFNGDGRSDLFLQARAVMETTGCFYYDDKGRLNLLMLANAGHPKPDLLTKASDGQGGKKGFSYKNSSEFTDNNLPFVIQALSDITVDDGLDTIYSKQCEYSGAQYSFTDREFRGFQNLTVFNPDGSTVDYEYHVDNWRKGQLKLETVKNPSEDKLTETSYSWQAGQDDSDWQFIKLNQKKTVYDDNSVYYVQEDYQYDSAGNLTSKVASGTDAETITNVFVYENLDLTGWMWRKTKETLIGSDSGEVRETYYSYYGDGNLKYEKNWLKDDANPTTYYTYDEYDNLKTETDANGNTTTYYYDQDTQTFVERIESPVTGTSENPINHVVTYQYNHLFGVPDYSWDENDNKKANTYDQFGRLKQVDTYEGSVLVGQTKTEYIDYIGADSPYLEISRVTECSTCGDIETYQYHDGLGRPIQTTTKLESGYSTTRSEYDPINRRKIVTGAFRTDGTDFVIVEDIPSNTPYKQTTVDALERTTRIETAVGSTDITYNNFTTVTTDPDGKQRSDIKDYLGRTIKVEEDPNGLALNTIYIYNAPGDLVEVRNHHWTEEDPDANRILMEYDTLGRKVLMDDPDMGTWTYTYDPMGNLDTQTDNKEQTTTFAYDALNRIISKTYSNGDPTVNYTYDLATKNGIGRTYQVSNTIATETYNEYDVAGNVLEVNKTITGASSSFNMQYEYDWAGRIQQIQWGNDDYSIDYSYYPGTSLLDTVVGSDDVQYAKIWQYTPSGKIREIGQANNLINTIYDYNDLTGRLEQITTTGSSAQLQQLSYSYYPSGDIFTITDHSRGVDFTYYYDDLHRLTRESSGGAYPGIEYTYDTLGNIDSKTIGDTTYDYQYNGNRPHAITDVYLNDQILADYSYDENGNMEIGDDIGNPLQPAQRSIQWNADNMPVNIVHSNHGTTEIYYDGEGKRVKKIAPSGQSTYYITDSYEVSDDQTSTIYIFAGNLRVAQKTGSTIKYFHKDHLNSSTVITDENGLKIDETGYTPFGTQREEIGAISEVNYKFTDQELDAESGLYNYDARLYDPIVGRFASADTVVPDWYNPQSLNRYAYTVNNPIKYTDPTGHYYEEGDDGYTEYDGPSTEENMERDEALGEIAEYLGDTDGHLSFEQTSDFKLVDRTFLDIPGAKIGIIPPQGIFSLLTKIFRGRNSKNIPSKVENVLSKIKSNKGVAPKGYKGGRTFKNDGRGGGQQLPTTDSKGNPVTYQEYDVNPYQKGVNRGAERIVRGSDGKSYYSSDHYKTFTRIE
jgi:RHS repeat-associated protein